AAYLKSGAERRRLRLASLHGIMRHEMVRGVGVQHKLFEGLKSFVSVAELLPKPRTGALKLTVLILGHRRRGLIVNTLFQRSDLVLKRLLRVKLGHIGVGLDLLNQPQQVAPGAGILG